MLMLFGRRGVLMLLGLGRLRPVIVILLRGQRRRNGEK